MRLAVFTAILPAGARLLINPAQVVAVTPFNNTTHIHVAVPNQNGHPFFYVAAENLHDVMIELNLAMSD